MPFVRLSANTTAIGAAGKIIKEGDFYEKIFYKASIAPQLTLNGNLRFNAHRLDICLVYGLRNGKCQRDQIR